MDLINLLICLFQIERELQRIDEEVIKTMFNDVKILRDNRYSQANELHRRWNIETSYLEQNMEDDQLYFIILFMYKNYGVDNSEEKIKNCVKYQNISHQNSTPNWKKK